MSLHLFNNKAYVLNTPSLQNSTKEFVLTIIDKIYSNLSVESIRLLHNGINYDTYYLKCSDGKFYLLKISFDPENTQLSRESLFLKKLKNFASGKFICLKRVKVGDDILCLLSQFPDCLNLKDVGRDFFLKNAEVFFWTHKALVEKIKPKRSKSGYLKELFYNKDFSKNFTDKTKSIIEDYTDYTKLEKILTNLLNDLNDTAPNIKNLKPCLSNINFDSIYLTDSLFFFDKLEGCCKYDPYLDLCDIILNFSFIDGAKDKILSAYKSVHKSFDEEKFKSFYDFCVKKKLLESVSDYLTEVYDLRCLRIKQITEIISIFYSNLKNFKKLPVFIDNQDFLLKTITEPVLGVKA
jgi:hypothetical protein